MDSYSSCGITKGNVVKRDDNVTSIETSVLHQAGISCKGTYRVIGNRFAVPGELAGKPCVVHAYGISGKLLYSGVVQNGIVQISKNNNRARNVSIVSFSPFR
jgi:hypothetical protein